VVLYKLMPVPEDFGLTPEEVRRIEAHGGAEHPRTMAEEFKPYLRWDVILVSVAAVMTLFLIDFIGDHEDHGGQPLSGFECFFAAIFILVLVLATRLFFNWALQQVWPITAGQRDKYAAYQTALEEWRAFKSSAPSAPSTPSQKS